METINRVIAHVLKGFISFKQNEITKATDASVQFVKDRAFPHRAQKVERILMSEKQSTQDRSGGKRNCNKQNL